MQPKVSVVIPCYNQAVYLPKAIASLQAQTLADWECIVVDDGSTDNTAEVASNLASNDKRIRLVQQQNEGSASARDAGLQIARGEFIQFLDADDTIDSEKFERQVALMEREELDTSYTAFCNEYNNQRTTTRFYRLNTYRILVRWGIGASVPIHAFMYRTTFIRLHNLSPKLMCKSNEDWQWHINCFNLQPKQTTLCDYCGATYHHHEQGKTGNYIKMQEANFQFMAYMTNQLNGWNKCLWAFRISEELWIWLLRMLKYRSLNIAKSLFILPTTWLIGAILLMPLSIFGVLRYIINTYVVQ